MTLSEIFTKAATLIEERGWCRTAFEKEGEGLCLAGAVRLAENGDSSALPAGSLSYPVLCEEFPVNINGVPMPNFTWATHWNDDPTRTKEEVVAKLQELAVKYA